MWSGSVCNTISLPCPDAAGRQSTPCAPFSMQSSTSCAPAVLGATCRVTFHRGKRSSTISDACALPGTCLHDSRGARCLLAGLAPRLSHLKKIWADAAYRRQELAKFCLAQGNWDLEVVERPAGTRDFSMQPRRWAVERTFGWLSRKRRLSKDDERKVQTSETLIQVAMIRLLLARAGHKGQPVPKPPISRRSPGRPTSKKRRSVD